MRIPALALLPALLAGCGNSVAHRVSQMTPAQVSQMNDNQMCEAGASYAMLQRSFLHRDTVPLNPAFRDEFERRQLSCDRRGMLTGWVSVGRGAAGLAAAAESDARSQAASDALIGAGLGLMARPQPPAIQPPRVIECSPTPGSLGRSINCW